jgi:hypothetical protein
MQQMNQHSRFSPLYVDKLILYFTPSGSIIVRIGNQYIVATASDVSELIEGRLAQHQLFAELFNRSNGSEA